MILLFQFCINRPKVSKWDNEHVMIMFYKYEQHTARHCIFIVCIYINVSNYFSILNSSDDEIHSIDNQQKLSNIKLVYMESKSNNNIWMKREKKLLNARRTREDCIISAAIKLRNSSVLLQFIDNVLWYAVIIFY